MVIMTIGELILIPTSTTYTASLAPAGYAWAVHEPLWIDPQRGFRDRTSDGWFFEQFHCATGNLAWRGNLRGSQRDRVSVALPPFPASTVAADAPEM